MPNGPQGHKRSPDFVGVTYPDLAPDSQDCRPGPSTYPLANEERVIPKHIKAMVRARLAAKEKISK